MELTLLGIAAAAAFVMGAAAVLVIFTFRRTVALRGALIEAMRRIERLEQAHGVNSQLILSLEDLSASPATEERFAAAARVALKADGVRPPPLWAACGIGLVMAAAALAAAQVRWISGQGGVDLALAAALLILCITEWSLRLDGGSASRAHSLSVLAGSVLALAAIVYGWVFLRETQFLAMTSAGLLSFATLALSLRYGFLLRGFAVTCAALAPAFAPMDAMAPIARYAFLAAFLAASMYWRAGAPILTSLAAGVTIGWGVNGAAWGGDIAHVTALGVYFSLLLCLGLACAWPLAGTPRAFPEFWRGRKDPSILLAGALVLASASTLTLLALAHALPLPPIGVSFTAMLTLASGATVLRPSLWPSPFAVGLSAIIALALWPSGASDLDMLIFAGSLLLVCELTGASALLWADDARPGVALAAFAAPLLLVATHARLSGILLDLAWIAVAFALALLEFVLWLKARVAKPTVAPAIEAGAATSLAATLYLAAPAQYAPLVVIPLLAWLYRKPLSKLPSLLRAPFRPKTMAEAKSAP